MFVLVIPVLTTERALSEAQEWGEENFMKVIKSFLSPFWSEGVVM